MDGGLKPRSTGDENNIGDMVELTWTIQSSDEDNTLPLIIDYHYTPGQEDIDVQSAPLIMNISSFPRHRCFAGRVPVTELLTLRDIPGVVMIELDGILTVANNDERIGHGVDVTFAETGYDGGNNSRYHRHWTDGNHTSFDDQDDDPTTYDPKILGFYDAVNSPDDTSGNIFPFDDQGPVPTVEELLQEPVRQHTSIQEWHHKHT